MTTTNPIRRDNYKNIFHTAVEGGINYWARNTQYRWDGLAYGYYSVIEDSEDDDKPYRIDESVIARGVNWLRSYCGDNKTQCGYTWKSFYWALSTEDIDYDSIDADMIVQAGLGLVCQIDSPNGPYWSVTYS